MTYETTIWEFWEPNPSKSIGVISCPPRQSRAAAELKVPGGHQRCVPKCTRWMTNFPSLWLSFTYKPYNGLEQSCSLCQIHALKLVALVHTSMALFFSARLGEWNTDWWVQLRYFLRCRSWAMCWLFGTAVVENKFTIIKDSHSTEVQRRWLGYHQHEKNLDDCQHFKAIFQILSVVLWWFWPSESMKDEHGPCELRWTRSFVSFAVNA